MSVSFWTPWREEAARLWQALGGRVFHFVAPSLLLLYALALQWPFAGAIDVGAGLEPARMNLYDHLVGRTRGERVGLPLDAAFLGHFHGEETGASYTFRWSEPEARFVLPGLAKAPLLLRLRLHGAPSGPQTTTRLVVQGRPLAEFAVPYPLHYYAFAVDPAAWSGDTLFVDLHSTALAPGGEDTRLLGVALDQLTWIGWRTGWRLSLPPTALFLAGVAVFLYLGLRRAGLKDAGAGFCTLLWGLVPLAGLFVPQMRAFVALYSARLFLAAAVSYPVLVLTLAVAGALLRRGPCPPDQRDWRWLAVLFLLSFLLRFGGALSPRYSSHDATFHAHRIEFIQRGDLFFEHVSLEAGLRSDPYPGTLYLLLAPLASLVQSGEGLLSFLLAWLGSSEVFLLWFLARLLVPRRASRWAALFYLVFPIGPAAYWFGIYANLFAVWATLLVVVAVLLVLQGRLGTSPLLWMPLFTLVFLAHFGNVILWCALSLVWGALLYWRQWPRQRVRLRRLAGAWLGALLISFVVYYSHFLPFFHSVFGGFGAVLQDSPAVAEAGLDRFSRSLAELRVWWRWGFVGDYAALGLPLGGLGVLASCRRHGRAVLSLLIAVVCVALGFWALSMVAFFFVRYMLFLLPVAAVGCGRICALFWQRGPAGKVVALILLAYVCAVTLWMWLGLCLFGLPPVHVL